MQLELLSGKPHKLIKQAVSFTKHTCSPISNLRFMYSFRFFFLNFLFFLTLPVKLSVKQYRSIRQPYISDTLPLQKMCLHPEYCPLTTHNCQQPRHLTLVHFRIALRQENKPCELIPQAVKGFSCIA